MASNDIAIVRLQAAVARLGVLTRDRPRTGVRHDDADDEAGTVATDDAVGFDPLPLLRALDKSGVKVVVIGQVAGIMHGSQELTGDLDLLWDGDPAGAAALAEAFAIAGAHISDDDDRPLPCAPESFRLPKVLFRAATASGDCCTPALPWGSLRVAQFLDRCDVATSADGLRIHYLRRDDLITMRRAVGRPKDVRRAIELARIVTTDTSG